MEDAKISYLNPTIKNDMLKIAGCLPPLSESYRSDLVGPLETNVLQYRVIVSSLISHVDLFLCETMSSTIESKSAVLAAVEIMKGNPF